MDNQLTKDITRRKVLNIGGRIMIMSVATFSTFGDLLAKEDTDFWGKIFRTESKPGTAKVIALNGRAFAKNMPLRLGQEVANLTTIRVPKRTIVRLRLPDETIVEIRGDAKFVLEIGRKGGGFLQLLWGAILAVVPKNKVNPYVIKGPTSVVGIKGTVFYMEVFPQEQTKSGFGDGTVEHPPGFKEYFCLCNGDADFINPESFNIFKKNKDVYHHKSYFMNFSGTEPQIEPAGMFNHTDLEIYELIKQMRKDKHPTDWLELYY